MKIWRVFSGNDGQSHCERKEIDFPTHNELGHTSGLHPVEGVVFRKWEADYDYDFHTAPRRHFVVILEGMLEMEVGSGEKHRLDPGTVFLVEDTTGKGHIMRAIAGPGRHLFIPME